MINLKDHSYKLAMAGVMAITALAGTLAPATAQAALVSGNASITIDNSAFSSASGFSVTRFYDSSYNTTAITGISASAGTSSTSDMVFPVNANTTTITNSAINRTVQKTSMDTNNTSAGQIGLSGGLKIDHPLLGSLLPYDFSLEKISGTWNLVTHSAGFGANTFLQLTDASESVNGNGELSLAGNLIFGDGTHIHPNLYGSWGQFIEAYGQPVSPSTVVGRLSLTPAAVPVPAAVWLFGSGMLGLLGAARRKPAIPA